MRKTATILILILVCGTLVSAGMAADPYNYEIKSIYKEPSTKSTTIYRVPAEIKMLDMSADANWFKIKIEFKMGLIRFQYIGWTYIPVGEILVKRYTEPVSELGEVKP